jgi:hypothetical protein
VIFSNQPKVSTFSIPSVPFIDDATAVCVCAVSYDLFQLEFVGIAAVGRGARGCRICFHCCSLL